MLDASDPEFADWDQDATAVEDGYATQDPAMVSMELLSAAEDIATAFDAIADDDWQRTGRRGDGSVFTVETLGRYMVHDPEHHLYDVAGVTAWKP
jgi:nitrogen regulatory protein PII